MQPFLLAPESGDLFISPELFDPRLRPRGIGDAFAVHLQTVSAMNMVLGDRMLMKAIKCKLETCDVFREWVGLWWASAVGQLLAHLAGWQLLAP